MREGVPDERVFSRELKVFGDVEVGHHRFLPGETAFPPLPGHLVNLHLGAPTRVVTRREGAGWEGTQPRGNVEVFSAGRATEQAIEGISEDVSVLLGEGFFRRVAEQAGVDPGQVEVMDRFDARDENVEWILLSLMPELGTDGLGGKLYVQSLATALAVHLLRRYSSLGNSARRRVTAEPRRVLPSRSLDLALDYIDANLAGDLSLTGISTVASVSPRQLLRLFKASTGLPPYQYVIQRRVERARTLLSETDLPLWEVAESCGFAHQQHLSTHFKRLAGVSPGRYRRLIAQ